MQKKGELLFSFECMYGVCECGNKAGYTVQVSSVVERRYSLTGTSLFKLYRYVSSQRVWFFSYFGLKTGIDFLPLWSNAGIIFKGTTRAYLTFQLK